MAEDIVAEWVPEDHTLVTFRVKKHFGDNHQMCFVAGIISHAKLAYLQKKKDNNWFDVDEELRKACITYVFLRGKTVPGALGVTDRIKWYLHSAEKLDDWVVQDGFRRLAKEFEQFRADTELARIKQEESEERLRKYVGVYNVVQPHQLVLEK